MASDKKFEITPISKENAYTSAARTAPANPMGGFTITPIGENSGEGFQNYLRNYNAYTNSRNAFANAWAQNAQKYKGIKVNDFAPAFSKYASKAVNDIQQQAQPLWGYAYSHKQEFLDSGMTEDEYNKMLESFNTSELGRYSEAAAFESQRYKSQLKQMGIDPYSSKGMETWGKAEEAVNQDLAAADRNVTINEPEFPVSSLEEIYSLQTALSEAEDNLNTARTNLGYATDPYQEAEARKEFEDAQKKRNEAKLALESAQKSRETVEKEGTSTSGAYEVAKKYNGDYSGATQEWQDLTEQMEAARERGDEEEYNRIHAIIASDEAYQQREQEFFERVATASTQFGYAQKFKWDDYNTFAAMNPAVSSEGLAKAEADYNAYLGQANSIFDTNEVAKVKVEHPTNEWTEEQKQLYGFLYGIEDYQKAAEYATEINSGYYAAKVEKEKENIKAEYQGENSSLWGKIKGYFGARFWNAGAIADAALNIYQYLDVGSILPKDYVTPTQRANMIDEAFAEELNEASGTLPENWFAIGGKGAGDIYNMANSIIESYIAGAISKGGWLGEAISGSMFFGPAATNALYDALENGATPGQAIMVSLASGTAELLFEEWSFDKIDALTDAARYESGDGVLKYLRSLSISFLIEGDEEMNTSVANWIAETLILQESSDSMQKIAYFMANSNFQGTQEQRYKEAWRRVFAENFESIAYDGIVGGISGAAHAGLSYGVKAIGDNRTYDNSKLDTNTWINGKPVTINEQGVQPDITGNRPAGKFEAKTASDLIDIAAKYGDTDLAEKTRGIMTQRSAKGKGETITQGQARKLAVSITPETYQRALDNEAKAKNVDQAAQMVDESARGKGGVTAETKNIALDIAGKKYTIEDIGYGNKREVRLKDAEGKTEAKSIDEVFDQLPEETQALITWADNILGDNAARAIYQYDGSQTIGEYVAATNAAIAVAAGGGKVEAAGNPLISTLNRQQLNMAQLIGEEMHKEELADTEKRVQAYDAAKAAAEQAIQTADVTAAQANIDKLNDTLGAVKKNHAAAVAALDNFEPGTQEYTDAKAKVIDLNAEIKQIQNTINQNKADLETLKKKVRFTARKKGTVSFGGGMLDGVQQNGVTGPLSKNQQSVVDMVNALADVFNFDYVFFDGDSRTGGAYVNGTGGKIFININSGRYANKYLAASTLSHELTHAMQEFAADKYGELKQYVIDQVIQKRGSAVLNKLVQNEIATGTSSDKAMDEVVANACSEMLMNSEAVRQLAAENSSLFEEVRSRIGDIVQKIQAAFADRDVGREAVRVAREFDGLQKIWDDAARAMVENKTNLDLAAQTIAGKTGEVYQKAAPISYEGGTEDDILNNVAAALENGGDYSAALEPFNAMIAEMSDEELRRFRMTGLDDYISESYASFEHEDTVRNAERALLNAVKTELDSRQGAEIKKGRTYTPTEIKAIFDKANKNAELAPLAEKVFAVAEKFGIMGDTIEDTEGAAVYDFLHKTPKTIVFNPNRINGVSDAGKAQILLHEYIHGVTSYLMTEVCKYSSLFGKDASYAPDWYKQNVTPEMERAVKTFYDVFSQLSHDPDFKLNVPGSFNVDLSVDNGYFYAAENVYEMVAELSNPNFVAFAKKKSLWTRIVDAIKTLFGIKPGATVYDALSSSLDYILENANEEAFEQYATNKEITQSSYEQSAHYRSDVRADTASQGVQYQKSTGEYDAESATIKQQIDNSQDKLNAMNPVANKTVPIFNKREKPKAAAWAIDQLKSKGFKAERQGFGTIYFDEDDISTAARYADTPAEKAALSLVYEVAKRGIEIGRHDNHDNREKKTVTFGAPVVLNGERGNMAVVVNLRGNHFYAERIVTPDGSIFVLPEPKNTSQELQRGVTQKGSLANATSDVSKKNISNNNSEVKKNVQFQRATTEEVGVNIDEETESANPNDLQFSRLSWEESEYYQKRDDAAHALAEALDVSVKKAEDYIDAINGVAKAIANDQQRLDYEASEGVSALVGNTEYGGSIDFSTICKKRRLLTGTFTAIQRALPNTALTADEVLTIRKMMSDKGDEVSCGLCYVEGSRAKMGEYAKQFLDEYAKTNPDYLPNMAEINTPEGIEQIRTQHPEIYEAYVKFMNGLAQRKPKLYQMATEYKNEVLDKFLGKPAQVSKYNHNGGLRLQSFSDFEIIHLIDNMQVIMDMARVGLNGQAYTKVPNFAWAMGKTGLKINLSLIAKGVDANGKLILDEKEGMKRADASALRNVYSDNVGTIIVVFNDDQLKAAMADDFIDFIIPFHRSQWNSAQYALMGLPEGAKDYTPWQNESYINPVYNKNGKKQRPDNFMPNNYWDYSKTGRENAEEYLRMCAEDNRKPKFSNLLVDNGDGSYSLQPDGSTDGYWKLLIDFKMYDNEGVGVPQRPVQPIFNEGSEDDPHTVLGMLKAYEGGHQTFPVDQEVVDRFVNEYKSAHPREQYQRWAINEDQTSMELADNTVAQNRLQVENNELKNIINDLNNQIKELVADAKKSGRKIDDLKRQMKQTDQPEVREADARRMASQLIRSYHSNVNADEITADIKALGDYLVQHTGEELDYAQLYDMAETVADKVVSEAYGLLDDPTGEKQIYKEITDMIRGRKFWLPEQDRGELDVVDGYNTFRKKNFGKFYLGEGGQSIDSFYEEMRNMYGDTYLPPVRNQGEMLMVLSDIFDQAKDEYGNPFAADQDQITNELANTILGDAIGESLRQMAPTFADKQQAKVKALQAKNKARMDALRQQKNERIADVYRKGVAMREQAIARERAKRYDQVKALKEHYTAKEQRAAERRGNSKVRQKIRKLVNELNARLKNPNSKRYVPVEFMQQTVDLLNMINMDTGKSASLTEQLGKLRNMYDSYKNNPTYSVAYDDTVSDMLKELAQKIGDTPLSKMTADQLDSVYNALKSLDYQIRNAVKVRIGEEEYNAYQLSSEMTRETRSVPKAQSNAFTKWFNAHLRADVMFKRLGGFVKDSTWEKMANMLNDGQLKQTMIQMALSRRFAELINDEKAMQHFTGTTFAGRINDKDLVDIGLVDQDGKPIKITHDMMVGIYMDLLNEDNARHFLYGGKTIPDLQKFYSNQGGFDIGSRRSVGIAEQLSNLSREMREAQRMGETERAAEIRDQMDSVRAKGSMYVQGIRQNIEKQLTAYDKKWIQATQALMNEDSKRYLNETTMDVYGIEKANVPNYFPIITDRNFLNTPFEAITRDMNLENAGFMKERVEASNPTYAMGTFTVVNNQINKVAQYCGLMPAIKNFNKVYNKTGAGYSDSLKQALSEKFGQEGTKYVENLIADLTGSRKEEGDTITKILGKLRGNLAQTSLTLNPRVALSQAASYPTAAAELGWRPLARALVKGGKKGRLISRADTELIAKYSPLLWYRMQGYTDTELGDLKNSNDLASKVWKKARWATGWIQAVDGATIGRLWNASEYWVQDNVKGVKVGTDEYYQEVAKKFNQVVERTQPNYTTMQKAAILRNPSSLTRMFTMFMTQRLQNFNILYNSVAQYQRMRADKANGRNDVTTRDVQTAKNDMIRAFSSQMAQAATYVTFKFLADALLHGLNNYRDKDDDELTAQSIILQLINNYIDALIGSFIFGSELYSLIKSAIGIEKWYGLSVNGVDTINDIFTDFINTINSWKDFDPEDEKSRQKLEKNVLNFAKSISQAAGLPLNNAVKIGNAMYLHIQDALNGEFLSFNAGFELDKDAVGIRMVNALKAGDQEKFDTYADTYSSTSSMYSAVEKQVKDGYLAKKQTITKKEAVDLLVEAGEPKRTAEKKVQQWTCELVTGIPYDKIDDQFMADKISEDRAAELYVTYGGMTKADAKSYVQQIKCEKVTGVKYSNIKSEYIAGNLTDAQVKSMLKTYGGKDETTAKKTVLKYSFEKETEYSWDDKAEALYAKAISDSKLAGYLQKISPTTYGTKEKADNYVRYLHFQHDYPRYADLSESNVRDIYEAKAATSLTMPQSIEYQIGISKCKGTDKNNDGKTDTNSLRDAKIKYILSLPYSYETKLALFKLSYTSKQALDAFKKAAGK